MVRIPIVFASVLKPVDDVRTCRKLAHSLVFASKYEINIIGFPTKSALIESEIRYHPLPRFTRKSLARFAAPWKVFFKIIALKPALLIINTHELLIPAMVLNLFFGVPVLYDIRENYRENVKMRGNIPGQLASQWIAVKERFVAPFIRHFLLAEKCYAQELPFLQDNFIVLENKALVQKEYNPNQERTNLVFTGTLAVHTGVLEAIDIADSLHEVSSEIQLFVCGNSMDSSFLEKIYRKAEGKDWIILDIDQDPVPYERIMGTLEKSHAAFMNYTNLQVIRNKMPTKLYEYLAMQLPVIIPADSPWRVICENYGASIIWNNQPADFLDRLNKQCFYTLNPGPEVLWESEKQKFIECVEHNLRY